MAISVTYDNIDKAYAAVTYLDDDKAQVRGQPHHRKFYDVRLISWLYTFQLARLGNAFAQAAMAAVPYVCISNTSIANISVTHNGETFTLLPNGIIPMRRNEAYFFIEKSTQAGTPLVEVPLANYFAAGKAEFVYW